MYNEISDKNDNGVTNSVFCVTNRKLCEEDFLTRIERIAKAKPRGIILREKDLSREEYKILAKEVMFICEKYNVSCILHSFVDVAIELQARAIHLPLDRLLQLRDDEKAKFKVIGASCHSMQDAIRAKEAGCTYIVVGHIFETDCKKGLAGRGLGFLQEVCECVDIPVYAIGGITSENIGSVREVGAVGVCIMSGLMRCEEPEKYLANMKEIG
ncbi:MAG: thiamine phosphate synthase [Lachnospiraceae bacterium]|nr:thiamine phosphate synthase [Lachnospiraceae bacterium]